MMFFTNLRAMTTVVASVFAMIFMLFYEPVLVPYLKHELGVSKKVAGNISGFVKVI